MSLITDLALILVVAGVVTLLFKKLKQPLVLGYIVAGFLVSPHMPYIMSVVDIKDIHTWADIGVTFLLFSLGLDFSFKKILKMGLSPVIAALTIVFSMMVLGVLVGHAFHWGRMDCIFLGGMLAMSSTTIIYKALDDLGLRQQKFAGMVMSVLILEDILAIVMMVMLSAIAQGSHPEGSQMLGSIIKIGFFLILWFVVGIFLIPWFLRSTRRLMSDETLLIVSLGLCCLMAVVSTLVGFSSAFGAFVMGSILAETVEADKIARLVAPVKDLFGAIFFVSVGMLVEPKVLVDYAGPIAALVATILVGQGIFGTAGFMFGGQPLKQAMRCGFCMAQIGEFAFIIASLGLSLGVISQFLYPVVVAVSVITTFFTPYMIRAAEPCYSLLEHIAPRGIMRRLDSFGTSSLQPTEEENSQWKCLLRKMGLATLIYTILTTAVTGGMLTFFLPFIRRILPHWWANGVCGLLTVTFIAPFLRAMIMKGNKSEEFRSLWEQSRLNRLPLLFTILARTAIAAAFLFYICNYLARFNNAIVITLALTIIILMLLSRRLKLQSSRMEQLFRENLRSRDIEAQVEGQKRPAYEAQLPGRDIHMAEFTVPEDSALGGKALKDLQWRQKFGIHVCSILRGHQRINIPGGPTVLFPGDRLQAIGTDDQLTALGHELHDQVLPEDADIEKREMKLRKIVVPEDSCLLGKTLSDSGIRERYGCMVVGVEEGQKDLTSVNPNHRFAAGDILWVVGEKASLRALAAAL